MCCYEKWYYYNTVLFSNQLLYYNAAVYVLVQSEEQYSLIWKAKPLKIQTEKDKW